MVVLLIDDEENWTSFDGCRRGSSSHSTGESWSAVGSIVHLFGGLGIVTYRHVFEQTNNWRRD